MPQLIGLSGMEPVPARTMLRTDLPSKPAPLAVFSHSVNGNPFFHLLRPKPLESLTPLSHPPYSLHRYILWALPSCYLRIPLLFTILPLRADPSCHHFSIGYFRSLLLSVSISTWQPEKVLCKSDHVTPLFKFSSGSHFTQNKTQILMMTYKSLSIVAPHFLSALQYSSFTRSKPLHYSLNILDTFLP